MTGSEKIDQLAAALVKAQSEMEAPPLDSTNPHFKSRFASLAAVRDAVVPALNRNGLAVVQCPAVSERGPGLTTLLLHQSGQWMELGTLVLPVAKQDAQGYGSAITYARRYALLAAAGVVAEDDDDGQRAARPAPAQPAAQPAALPGARRTSGQIIPPAADQPRVNDAQLRVLAGLVRESNTDVAKLCAHYKIAALGELPAALFPAAAEALRRKMAKAAAPAKEETHAE